MNLHECSNLEEFPEFLEPMEHLESIGLTGTAIKDLPGSIENLIGLTHLYLQGCKDIEYLPKNMCKLSRLLWLDLTECLKLQTLPPCPPGLKLLDVSYCESLKLIEELPPNLIKFNATQCASMETISSQTNKSFWMIEDGLNLENCSKLDQNTQNFVANSAIFSVFHAKSHGHMGPHKRVVLAVDFFSCYQGDEIPNEFRYQSMGSSMNINLPPYWNSNDFLGFAFCIVFYRSKADADISFDIQYEIDDGHACKRDEVYLGESNISLDHVLMWYSTIDDEIFTCSSDATEVSFNVWPMFRRAEKRVELGSDYCNIKKCGIGLVYKNDLK